MDKQSVHNKKLDNALDYCIKLISSGATVEECLRLYPNLRKELRELLSVAVGVNRSYPDYPELRPSKLYTKTSREKFIAAIEGGVPAIESELFKPKASRKPALFSPRGLFGKYAAVGIAAVMLIVALGGLLYASGSSLPGNPLYGLKRAVEGAELAMTFDKEGKDRLRHEFSKRRMDETNLLAKLSKGKAAVLGYKISKDTTKDNSNNLKPNNLIDKSNAANSATTKPKTTGKTRSKKKGKKKHAVVATTTTTPALFSINLKLPDNETTITGGNLQFSWDDNVSGATYSLYFVSVDTDTAGTSITLDKVSNPYAPTGDARMQLLTQLLGDANGVKKWKWCVIATTANGRTTSNYRTFNIEGLIARPQ